MKIVFANQEPMLQDQAHDCIAEMLPVEVYEKEAPQKDIASVFSIAEAYQRLQGGVFLRKVRVTNVTNRDYQIQLRLSALTGFVPQHWLIPCVMYNGNPFGAKNSPKGLLYHGKPWVFSYDRSGIPACTLSENHAFVFASFASDCDARSLQCSCSVEQRSDGRFLHRLIYPVTEGPVSYTGKNIMTNPFIEYLPLPSGASAEFTSYLFAAIPPWPNYGFLPLLQSAMPLFHNQHLPALHTEEIRRLCLSYLKKSRWKTENGWVYSCTCRDYTHPIGNGQTGGPWDGLTLKMIEEDPALNQMMYTHNRNMYMGFSAQGMMTLRMVLKDALENADHSTAADILHTLDAWANSQMPNGLVSITWPAPRREADPSNLGWGASEMIKIYLLLKDFGIVRDRYLSFAKGICDFFVQHFDPADPFGRQWSLDGEKLCGGGSNGSFLVKAMLELYEVCGDAQYLRCASQAFQAYFHLELDFFRCSAGAIDCESVDKESAYPFVYAGLALYRATGEIEYLHDAEKAAAYFLSWMFCYDAQYPENSDFSRLGYNTSGGTVVSVEHQCIDPYAAVCIPDLFALSNATKNPLWARAGRMIWANCSQCIAGKDGMYLHGMLRPAGAQNECFAQTRWSKYRTSPEARGHLNDFIGIWLCCFKLYAMDQLGDARNLLERE